MQTEKLSLKGITNVLSRRELKKIMAGSGGGGGNGYGCGQGCYTDHGFCQCGSCVSTYGTLIGTCQ